MRAILFIEYLQSCFFVIDKRTPFHNFLDGGPCIIDFGNVFFANPNRGDFAAVDFGWNLDLLWILRRERWLEIDELGGVFVGRKKVPFKEFVAAFDDSRC